MPPATQPLRYVIQRHSYAGFDHFDFMFEEAGRETLRSFQLPDEPTPENLAAGISCRELAPHRKDYLSYEGEVSRGRGTVKIWDAGLLSVRKATKARMELALESEREMRHPTWMLSFMGGADWHLVVPNVSGRWALKYL